MDTFRCLRQVHPDQLSEGVRQLVEQELAAVAGGMAEGRDISTREMLNHLGYDVLLVDGGKPVLLVWPKPAEGLDEIDRECVQTAIDDFGTHEGESIMYDGPHGFIESGWVEDMEKEELFFITAGEAIDNVLRRGTRSPG